LTAAVKLVRTDGLPIEDSEEQDVDLVGSKLVTGLRKNRANLMVKAQQNEVKQNIKEI
jgi:hypothetical protein